MQFFLSYILTPVQKYEEKQYVGIKYLNLAHVILISSKQTHYQKHV